MKAAAVAATIALAAAALPSAAGAVVYHFTTVLNGANEAPPNASTGTGFANAVLDDVAHTLTFSLTFQDLVGTTTASHVHAPTALPNIGTSGIATELPTFTGFQLGVTSGSYDHTFDTTQLATWNPAFVTSNGGTALGAETGFLNALLNQTAYLNIHTTFRPGGEIRGFFALVPEPSTWAMMIAGFGLTGAALRRRRRAAAVRVSR